MRLDPVLLDQPVQQRPRAVRRVGDQALGPQAEAVHGPIDHGPCGAGLGLTHRARRLDVHDDRVVGVDQVVVRVGEEGRPLQRARPLRRRVGMGGELRGLAAGGAEGGVVQRLEILLHRARREGRVELLGGPLMDRRRVLLVGVGADEAGVHGETLAAHQALGDAAFDDPLEQATEQIAVTEAPVTVLRERGMIRDRVGQVEPAEPAIRQVEMHLVAQPPLRPDAHHVADQQHADHQLGIDRGTADRAGMRRQLLAEAGEVDEPVDPPQKAIRRHVILDRELVEKRALRHLPRSHHRRSLPLVSAN